MRNSDERFQERVDELLFLENKVEGHIEKLVDVNRRTQKVYEEVTKDLYQKIENIGSSLKKIDEASDKISDYMRTCDKHAQYTRNIFMSSLAGSVIVICATLWWANHLKNDLAQDRKEFENLEFILKNEPVLKRVDGKDYVRLANKQTTDMYDENGHLLEGDYAEVWHKR